MNPLISAFLTSSDTPEQFFTTHPTNIDEIASAVTELGETDADTFAKSPRALELVRWITQHPVLELRLAFELDEFLGYHPLQALSESDRTLEFIFSTEGDSTPWGVEETFRTLNRSAQLAILRQVKLTPPSNQESYRMLKLLIICGEVNIPDEHKNQRLLIDKLVAHAKEIIGNNSDDLAMTPHLVEAAFTILEMTSL